MPSNPHLPEKPADGKHSFEGPTDIGGNSRCTFCGAYKGSVEGERTCEGEFRESGRMRLWAQTLWARDRARAQGQPRRIAQINTEQIAPRLAAGILFSTTVERYVLLECGHRVSCQLETFDPDEEIGEWIGDEVLVFGLCGSGGIEVFGCAECTKRFEGAASGTTAGMVTAAERELENRPDLRDPSREVA